MLEALEGLLENGGDVAEAARALHLHRASLYRRLARVEEITGFDLSRGDDRLLAHLGLRLYRLAKGGRPLTRQLSRKGVRPLRATGVAFPAGGTRRNGAGSRGAGSEARSWPPH